MADNNNLTVYQKLFYLFGQGGGPKMNITTNKYNLGGDNLIITKSREDFEKEKLQQQQQRYLQDQWTKVDSELYQKAVFYETSRVASYMDFESMEFTPEIAVALDTMSEESCTINEQGKILSIYSESSRVKKVLEDLFFNVLDIHSNLPMWTRNTPIRENSIIPLLDGTEITIKELSEKVKSGEEVWTYSIQDGTKSIVPSKIVWCDLTRKNSELYRVTLDDGTYLDTTPDHEYMLRDGSFKRADELTKGQSLMPFYSRKSEKKKDRIVGYEKVFNPNTGKYKFTHTMVAHGCIRDLEQEKLIGEQFDTHHVDFNKLNNHPNNLVRLTHSEHFKLHVKHLERTLYSPEVIKKRMGGIDKYLRSDKRRKRLSEEMKGIYPKYFKEYNNSDLHTEHNKIRSLKMLSNWGDPQFIEKTKKGMIITINNECLEYISSIIKNSDNYIGINKLSELLKSDFKFIELLKKDYTLKKDITKSINPTTLKKVIYRKTNKNYFDFILDIKPEIILDKNYIKAKSIFEGKTKNSVINHKVVSVVKLDEKSDVYCLEAVGPNGEHDRHNFPVLGKHEDGSYSRTSGVFLSNCKYGDNFVYLKLHNKDGIVGSSQLTNIEIERKEDNQFKFGDQEEKKGKEVKFIWKDKNMEFNAWEIAHFRLLGDDRKLPYGTSVLEKVRAIWKKLLLAEDAMLVYRVTRAPERRVFKVYVGNIDDADVEAYVQKVANKFKRTQTSDRQTGQVDIRYNTLAVDQDYFVPVRDPNASMPIETLPGASNLDQIADLQYIQRKMVTALRVPKTFLGFEETVGEGKNLALLDIRFARTINRIQQAMIQELNKIAIIHLYILGFHDELNNFKLTLNNPSTQGEMLKVEQWKEKVLLYKDLVSAVDGGIAPTSHTWAKKNIFNWSADEILEDLEQQRLERAASKELEMTPEVIKNTGFFKKVDKLYGEIPTPKAPEEGGMGGESEGGFGGDEAGGGFGDLGGFGGDFGGGDETGGDFGGGETEGGFGEGFRGDENVIDRLLLEGRKRNEDILIMTKGIDELLNEENIDDDELLID
jgi:hypothetical protein